MAQVFLANEEALDRKVAVKVIWENLASNEEFANRFKQEVKTLAKLEHGNIATIYNFFSVDDLLYYTMRYVPGKTLSDLMVEKGKYSLEDTIDILKPIAMPLKQIPASFALN